MNKLNHIRISFRYLVCSFILTGAFASNAATVLFGNPVDLGANSRHTANFLLGTQITIDQSVNLLEAGVIFRTKGYNANIGLYSASSTDGLPDQLLATTGAFPVLAVGTVTAPFTTAPLLNPGTYWFMAVFDSAASVGKLDSATDLVAYSSLAFTPDLPASFGAASTYTRRFNFFLVTQSVPEPTGTLLIAMGVFAFLFSGRCRYILE